MKITIRPNRETTKRTRSKSLDGEHGRHRVATIQAEQEAGSNDTTRRIRIVSDTEGYPINKRDRKNENGGQPTELEAMNQLNQAWLELQDEAEEAAREEWIQERTINDDQSRTSKETGATKTEAEAADEIEDEKREIITRLA